MFRNIRYLEVVSVHFAEFHFVEFQIAEFQFSEVQIGGSSASLGRTKC